MKARSDAEHAAKMKKIQAAQAKKVAAKTVEKGLVIVHTGRDIAAARAAWDEVKRMIADPSYAMVIADELNIVLRYDYLPVGEVLEALSAKPHMTHVIITGRNAPEALIDAADLVTEMAQVKHPFREQNVKAQRGIEF